MNEKQAIQAEAEQFQQFFEETSNLVNHPRMWLAMKRFCAVKDPQTQFLFEDAVLNLEADINNQ